jgi:hypothetical protein
MRCTLDGAISRRVWDGIYDHFVHEHALFSVTLARLIGPSIQEAYVAQVTTHELLVARIRIV